MVGKWVRPFSGESLIGEVVAVSGDRLVCRPIRGVQFEVALEDVVMGRAEVLEEAHSQGRIERGNRLIVLRPTGSA